MRPKFAGVFIRAPRHAPRVPNRSHVRVNDTKYSVAELWELSRDLAKGRGRVVSYGVRIDTEDGRVSLVIGIERRDGSRDVASMHL